TPAAPADASPQYVEAVELFETVFEWIAPELTDAEIAHAFQAARAEWRRTPENRAEVGRRKQASPGTSLLSLLGEPPAPGATVSAPNGPVMADPAWVFEQQRATAERRSPKDRSGMNSPTAVSEPARAELLAGWVAEAKAIQNPNDHQIRQNDSGEAPSLKERLTSGKTTRPLAGARKPRKRQTENLGEDAKQVPREASAGQLILGSGAYDKPVRWECIERPSTDAT
ncbi:hypothetical protein ACIQYO_26680, partial [Methylobacterium sp. NPDC097178]